jgi:hypothetical protein
LVREELEEALANLVAGHDASFSYDLSSVGG